MMRNTLKDPYYVKIVKLNGITRLNYELQVSFNYIIRNIMIIYHFYSLEKIYCLQYIYSP